MEMIHISEDLIITDPVILEVPICLFENINTQKVHIHKARHLLENEDAVFTEHNLTLTFKDPILFFPQAGKVIIKSTDFEAIYTVPEDLSIALPFEILAYKTDISLVYISTTGKTVTGNLHITGKKLCQQRHCYWCLNFFKYLNCYPIYITYAIYIALTFLSILVLWSVKFILKASLYCLQCFILTLWVISKLLKLIARFSLLLGSYIGTITNSCALSVYFYLERHRQQNVNISLSQLVLFMLVLQAQCINADCNTQAIIHSELKACHDLEDGTSTCKLHTTAELTLPSISSETCLYFTGKNEQHLFTLKIQLEAITCAFTTEREYYTFPVTPKTLSQISCIYNNFCGQGEHCIKERVGKSGLNFEAESHESRDFPGKSGCIPSGLGSGCLIITRPACSFYRIWYEPDLLHSYEVSKITGHTCRYHIAISHVENNTHAQIEFSDYTITSTGIRISVLGAYDQPQLHFTDSLVQRVGNPSEAYLTPTAPKNRPDARQIGRTQANTSFTKDFIFDKHMSECDFFEDRLRCTTGEDPIWQLKNSQEHALPKEKQLHLFKIKEQKLVSTLLYSSAVRLQLSFQDYKFYTKSSTVCPKFGDAPFEITGCYKCPILARLQLTVYSTCNAGLVFVSLEKIQIHTKALRLSTEPSKHVIKFASEQRCVNEKLCLRAKTLIQCQTFHYCLEEPSIELQNLNINYTVQRSQSTATHWLDWIKFPSLGAPIFFLKLIGSSLLILCAVITIISTLITCCCKRN